MDGDLRGKISGGELRMRISGEGLRGSFDDGNQSGGGRLCSGGCGFGSTSLLLDSAWDFGVRRVLRSVNGTKSPNFGFNLGEMLWYLREGRNALCAS